MQQVNHIQENIRFIIFTGTFIFLSIGVFLVFFLIYFRNNKNRHILEKQNLKLAFQEALLQSQLEIQEQTLRNISQEIHDNIGQVLSLAKINLATMDIEKSDQLKTKISDSKQLVTKAIQDLRDLSKSMNTDNIEAIGFLRALEYEVEMIRKAGFEAELNVTGAVARFPPQKELILFRILQEIINNTIKHANAKKITIHLFYGETALQLIVRDNGEGFELAPLNEPLSSAFGLGIRNMNNRAKLIGGSFEINSTRGEGTTVTIIVPTENHLQSNAK